MLHRMAMDQDQHPVDQYRTGSEYYDMVQYLVLLYLHSKQGFYKKIGKEADYLDRMTLYKDLTDYFGEFDEYLQEIMSASDYAEVRAQIETVHTAIQARMYKPLPLRMAFRKIKLDVNHIHQPKLKAILRGLVEYFAGDGASNLDAEKAIIEEMRIVRNPRLRKILNDVEVDLPRMVQADVVVLTQDDLNRMDRVELATAARDAKDDKTLRLVWEHAQKTNERTALTVMFTRGYLPSGAADVYQDLKLVTQANFKRLSPEVLYKYLHDMPYEWNKVFAGKSLASLYQATLPDKPDIMAKLVVEGFVGFSSSSAREDLERLAANTLPQSYWTPEIIRLIWKYADVPGPMVRKLSKQERMDMFKKGGLESDVWLEDITKEEMFDLLKFGATVSAHTISDLLGPGWGEIVGDGPVPKQAYFIDFFSRAAPSWLEGLNAFGFFKKFRTRVLDSYEVRDSKGGQVLWFQKVYEAASPAGKHFLLLAVGKGVFSRAVDSNIPSVPELEDVLRKTHEDRIVKRAEVWDEFQKKYGGKLRNVEYQRTEYFTNLPDDHLVEIAREFLESGVARYGDNAALFKYMVNHVPTEDIADLIDLVQLRTGNGYWDSEDDIKTLLERAPAQMSLIMVRNKSSQVRKWVVENYPGDKFYHLVKQNPEYLEYTCQAAPRIPKDMLEDMATFVETSWPVNFTASLKMDSLGCLVAQMDDATKYMSHTDSKVWVPACRTSKIDAVRRALSTATNLDAIFLSCLKRPDFGTEAADIVEMFVDRAIASGSRISVAALRRLDAEVPRMAADVFQKVARITDRLGVSFWGVFAYEAVTYRGADGPLVKDRWDGGGVDDSDLMRTLTENTTPARLVDLYKKGPWPDANKRIRALVLSFYYNVPGFWDLFTDEELKDLSVKQYYNEGWSYSVISSITNEMSRRATEVRARTKGSLQQRVLDLGAEGKYEEAAAALADALKIPAAANGVRDVVVAIYKSKDDLLKVGIAQYASDSLLGLMREAHPVSLGMAYQYCREDYFNSNFDALLEKHFKAYMEAKNPAAGKNREPSAKAAVVDRSDAAQALRIFKFYFLDQKEFSPKAVDSFVQKLEDPKHGPSFRKLLKAYLLSKDFHLRIKAITTEMLPLVMKLDDPEVTAKFNGSSFFRSKSIGKVDEYFNGLTQTEKEDFIRNMNDRDMLEKLLKSLVERTVPLSAPVNEEFSIGSVDTAKARPLLSRFSLSTRSTSHLELFNLSLENTTTTELKDWILTNPLLVFAYNKTTDVSKANIRVDPVSDDEDKRIAENFLSTWDRRAHSGYQGSVERVYQVVTNRAPHHPSANKKIMWHGTDYFAAGCIIQGGFKVGKAKTGRMLGDGVYFADVASKVMQYVSQNYGRDDSAGVVFVCEVDLGNMLTLDGSRAADSMTKTWMNHGYDSVYAPKGGGMNLVNSEYCVHDPKRIKILYVMDMTRKSTR